jgi:hypothetical protein
MGVTTVRVKESVGERYRLIINDLRCSPCAPSHCKHGKRGNRMAERNRAGCRKDWSRKAEEGEADGFLLRTAGA